MPSTWPRLGAKTSAPGPASGTRGRAKPHPADLRNPRRLILLMAGAFSSVRYAEGGIDPGADLLVQGKVLRALLHNGILGTSYDYSAEFRAVRALDGAVLWEKTIARKHGASMSDPVELTKALWQSLFGEARDELVKALEVRRSELFGPKGAPAAPASGTEESVEDILNRINDQ